MVTELYRVREPLRGVDAGGAKGIFTIPKGATVGITTCLDGDRFTSIVWDGVTVRVFTQDFKERTIPVKSAS